MGLAAVLLVCLLLPRCLVLRAAGAGFGLFPRCCVGFVCCQLYGCGLPAGCAASGHGVRCLGSGFGCCPASVGLSAGLRLLGSGLCFPAVVLLVCFYNDMLRNLAFCMLFFTLMATSWRMNDDC